MSRTVFTGVYVPLVTPFGADGEVSAPVLQRLIDWTIEHGASGLVPCGTTGESATLTHEEHQRVIALTVEYAAGRVPVIAGTGSNSTQEAIDLTVAADELGVDGMLLIAPYYVRPNQRGLLEHFRAVAAATEKPIIMYNIPKRTGVNIDAATIIALSKVPNITGIKEASGDVAQIMEIIQGTEDFSVLTGDDNLLFTLCALGGHGGICTSSHFLPGEWNRMVALLRENRLDEARALHYRLLPLAKALFLEPNPCPLKAGLELLGFPVGAPRLPMVPAGAQAAAAVRAALEGLGLL
ncbi:MAG TPA: 4-hydroxy-tetrahydrodipicolinate synthase [Armatimonadota bacterium]|nr:4-hydroxy-tetrahydrodipicolinate synthase [Armatimonadota bacterium]